MTTAAPTASTASATNDAAALFDVFRRVRARTDALAAPLDAEDCLVQSMPDVSPTKWHLAHTTWFFETFALMPSRADYRVFDDAYAYLFNSYYNTVGAMHPRPLRGLLSRPPLADVLAYRRYVDEGVEELLLGADPERRDELEAVVELGLHHEQQHQELVLTDIKHVLWCTPLRPVYRPAGEETRARRTARRERAAPLRWLERAGETAWIGHDGQGFAFDNEAPRHRQIVEPFAIASRAVSNGEYADFIADDGYRRPELWLSDGWARVGELGWEAPLYWYRDGETWRQYTLAGDREVDAAEPVTHLSYYEADAYAQWAGARLPSEAEWELCARDCAREGNFADGERFHPAPVMDDGEPAARPRGMFGDCWEWTRSAYAPYPGYRPPAGALGEYNGKFMSGQMVLRGGSCATPASHVRASYRNFFPPEARWQFSGLRLARDTLTA
jgi:ergothioneine biosynthesis protein EgtB